MINLSVDKKTKTLLIAAALVLGTAVLLSVYSNILSLRFDVAHAELKAELAELKYARLQKESTKTIFILSESVDRLTKKNTFLTEAAKDNINLLNPRQLQSIGAKLHRANAHVIATFIP